MTTTQIQQALVDAGYDVGPTGVDGKMGPHTRAAMAKYQADKGRAITDGGTGSVDQQAEAAIEEKYPSWGWLWNDPEVGPLLRQGLPADVLEQKLQQTNWYKNRTESQRNWLAEAALDPSTARQRLIDFDEIGKVQQSAASFGIPMTFDTAKEQYDRVVRGGVAPDALIQEFRNTAKNLYGQDTEVAKAIDAGQTVDQIFEPYRQIAIQQLGINPADIRINDPKWNSLLSFRDDKGVMRLPTQDEAAKIIRTDQRYGFNQTQNGRDLGFGLINAINKGFGMSEIG